MTTKTVGESTRTEVLGAYGWQHNHAIRTARALRAFGSDSPSEVAAALAEAATWRKRLSWALGAAHLVAERDGRAIPAEMLEGGR